MVDRPTRWLCAVATVWLAGVASPACARVPASRPTTPAPLPAKALVKLAALRPPVRRPATRPVDVPTAPAAREALQAGEKLLGGRRPEQAIPELLKALAADPNAARAHRLLAFCYVATRRWAEARPHLETLARTAGDDVRVQMLLGRSAQAAGRSDEAIRRYRIALTCSDAGEQAVPTNELLLLLGEALRRGGYLSAALECNERLGDNIDRHGAKLRASSALRPLLDRPELLLIIRGRNLMALRRYGEAAEVLDAAFRQNKLLTAASGLLIEALVAGKAYDRAEGLLVELLQGPTPLGGSEMTKAIERLYGATGDRAGPARLLKAYKVSRPNPPVAVLMALARACANLEWTDRASAILSEHRQLLGGQLQALMTLASWMLAEDRVAESLDVLADVLAADAAYAERVSKQIDAAAKGVFTKTVARRRAAAAGAERSPRKVALHYLAGLLARRVELEHLAEQQWELAVAADAAFVPAYEALARMYIDREQYDRVGGLVDRARAQGGPSHIGHYLMGWAELAKGESAKGIASLTQAVKAKGDHAPSRLLLAEALVAVRQYVQAEQHLLAVTKTPEKARGYEQLFWLHLKRYRLRRSYGDTNGSAMWLNRARDVVKLLQRSDSNDRLALRLQVNLQDTAGQFLAARETLGRLLALAPDDVAARLLKVRVEARTGLPAERLGRRRAARAIAELNEALAIDPSNAAALSLLADVYVARMRYGDAVGVLTAACKRNPRDNDLAMQYVMVLRQAGRAAEAVKVLGRQLEAARKPSEYGRVLYAALLCDAGKGARAVEMLTRWIAEETDDDTRESYRMALPYAEASAGKVTEALARVKKLLDKKSDWVPRDMLQSARVAIHAQARQYDQLVAQALKWFDGAPAAQWQMRQERHLELARHTEMLFLHAGGIESRRRNPAFGFAETPIELALRWLCAAKQFDRAETVAAEQIRRLDARGGAHAKLASALRVEIVRLLVMSGQRDRARKLYDTLVVDEPDNVDLLGMVYGVYREDDPTCWAKCDRLLERAAKAEPFDPQAANNLGYVWADRGVNLDRAESLIRAALARRALSNIQDSMGWVKYKKGDFDAALAFLLLSVSAPAGDNAVVYDHIGDTYWRLGRSADAVRMWIEAADLAEVEVQREGDRAVHFDVRRVARQAPEKIKAVKAGRTPPVAPLGQRSETRPASAPASEGRTD